MKNICLSIMYKSIAPTELKQTICFLFYKAFAPTELFDFSKMEIEAMDMIINIKKYLQ